MAKITITNTWAKIEGTPNELADARILLTYRVEGYQFMQAYKMKRWDGRKTLMTSDNRFPAGLAGMVAGQMSSAQIIDQREKPVASITWGDLRLPKGKKLQEHQERAITRILQMTRGVVHHSVGAGKSVVIIEAVRRLGVPTLIIVPTKDLLYQLHADFTEFIGSRNRHIGLLGDGVWQPQDVTIATVQTITRSITAARGKHGGIDLEGLEKRRRMLDTLSRFQAIFIDECHHLPSESYSTLMTNLPGAYYRIGCSATPMRSGAKEQELLVTGLTGPVIHSFLPGDAIEAGRSVPTDVYMVEAGGAPPDDGEVSYTDRAGRKHIKRDYMTSVESGIVTHEERNRKIVKLADAFGKRGPTVVLTERLEHGRILAAGLAERGHEEVH
jgi:superfamily II DNA or RNA helicase